MMSDNKSMHYTEQLVRYCNVLCFRFSKWQFLMPMCYIACMEVTWNSHPEPIPTTLLLCFNLSAYLLSFTS